MRADSAGSWQACRTRRGHRRSRDNREAVAAAATLHDGSRHAAVVRAWLAAERLATFL